MSDGIKSKLEGLKGLQARFLKMRVGMETSQAALRGGMKVQSEAVMLVQRGPASGLVYTRGKIKHQASAPGEAPMSDTGNLASNIVLDFIREGHAQYVVVRSRAPYSKALEYGTKNMEPRPFLGPAYSKHKESIILDIVKEANQKIKAAKRG